MKKITALLLTCVMLCLIVSGNSIASSFVKERGVEGVTLDGTRAAIRQYWSAFDYDSFNKTKGIVWERQEDGLFHYPLNTKSIQWKSLQDHIEMIAATTIPIRVWDQLTNIEKVLILIEYPLLIDIFEYPSFDAGFWTVSAYFPKLEELPALLNEDEVQKAITVKGEKTFITVDENDVEMSYIQTLFLKKINDLFGISPSQTRSYVYVTTPNGTAVPCLQEPEGLTNAQKLYMKMEEATAYPYSSYLSEATTKYNCHSYAWYMASSSNVLWMNSPADYMSDGSYSYVGTAGSVSLTTNQRIYYLTDHSAIVYSSTIVRSKWGSGCLRQHAYTHCPYYVTPSSVKVYVR